MLREKIINISDKVTEYSLYGLIFFLPFSKAGIEICAVVAILAFFIKKIVRPEFKFIQNNKLIYFFLLLFILFMASSLFNSGPYLTKSLTALFFKWIEYIFIFIITADTFTTRRRIRNAIAVILFSAILVGFSGLSQRFIGLEFLRGREIVRVQDTFAITSSFNHYNDFAAYLVCILPLVIALFSLAKTKLIYRTGLFLITILLISSLLLTFSRGGWLGFLATMFLMLFLSRKWKVILATIFIFIIMLISVPVIRERTVFTFQRGGDVGRFAIWQAALGMIKENPFLGKGLGTFMDYFPKYASDLSIQYAHNCYLQIWAESGIFSLLSFLLFVGSVFYRRIRAFKHSSLSNPSLILLGLICGIFGFLVHSFFDTQLYSLQLCFLFWVLFGLTVALSSLLNQDQSRQA